MALIKYHEITSQIYSGIPLIATEKLDGSNIGIGYVKNTFRIQSRNVVLDEKTRLFNLNAILEPLSEKVRLIKDILHDNFIIYGEVFGSHMKRITYRDFESEAVFGSKTVFFRAFDIYQLDSDTFMKYSDAVNIFQRVKLPHVPILDLDYQTIGDLYEKVETYPSAYAECPLEGFVMKADAEESPRSRNIFKVKRKQFNEQALNKYKIKNYVNYNRYLSAYSKIGEDFEKIKEEMVSDSLKDIISVYEKDEGCSYDLDSIRTEIENEADKLIKKFSRSKMITK